MTLHTSLQSRGSSEVHMLAIMSLTIYPMSFQESPISDSSPASWFRVNSLPLLTKIFVGGTCKYQIKTFNE